MKEFFGEDLIAAKVDNPVEIRTEHIINVLKKYNSLSITKEVLLDWINIIWFSELFEYNDEQADSISSVMNELKGVNEDISKLSEENIIKYIDALSKNKEL